MNNLIQSFDDSLASITTEDEDITTIIAKDQLKSFILMILNDDPQNRSFVIPENVKGNSDLFLSNLINYITLTKKDASKPQNLEQFVKRNLDIINFEIKMAITRKI